MKEKKRPTGFSYFLATALAWTMVLAGLLAWNIVEAREQMITQASIQTRTFYHEFLITRFWNALHGGVYVPVTEDTRPNPYLADDPLRDVITRQGLKLTKLNPAFMSRQLAEISALRGKFFFHLAGLDPISSQNQPDQWEKQALLSFKSGRSERFELVRSKQGVPKFRYMGSLVFEKPCISCHAKYGVTEGELSGGISITVDASPLVASRNHQVFLLIMAFSGLWVLGLTGVGFVFNRLRQEDRKQEEIIDELQEALIEVKQLSGLLPICCSCKKIRDDKGYWQSIEKYISEHSEAQFTHGLCKECAHKLYPEIYKNTDG